MPITFDPGLDRFWTAASDDDVLGVVFPPGSRWENAALARVYYEFVRRELEPPPDVTVVPPEQRSTVREDAKAYIRAVALFTAMCGAVVLFILLMAVNFGIPGPVVGCALLVFGLWAPLFYTLYVFREHLLRTGGRDRLTRCGACGHILRGLTEPRCPECGERI